MISFPNAKINLGLQVLNKRSDGYHNLETSYFPVPLCDILEIIKCDDLSKKYSESFNPPLVNQKALIQLHSSLLVEFVVSGSLIDGSLESNLCIEAFKKYDEFLPLSGKYFMHLHKIIPSGAGLGGGSSDGSFALKMINHLNSQSLNDNVLHKIASMIGSDCPAFLINKPSIGMGRGELLEQIDLSLNGFTLVIVKPPVHVNTAQAFKNILINEESRKVGIKNILKLPREQWKNKLVNDFEHSVFGISEEIKNIKTAFYHAGALYASLTGSGSAVYGLFNKHPGKLNFPETYFYFETVL